MTYRNEVYTVFMYDTSYTYDMYNYNIKYNVEFFYNDKI